jgi:hypothetical protein
LVAASGREPGCVIGRPFQLRSGREAAVIATTDIMTGRGPFGEAVLHISPFKPVHPAELWQNFSLWTDALMRSMVRRA